MRGDARPQAAGPAQAPPQDNACHCRMDNGKPAQIPVRKREHKDGGGFADDRRHGGNTAAERGGNIRAVHDFLIKRRARYADDDIRPAGKRLRRQKPCHGFLVRKEMPCRLKHARACHEYAERQQALPLTRQEALHRGKMIPAFVLSAYLKPQGEREQGERERRPGESHLRCLRRMLREQRRQHKKEQDGGEFSGKKSFFHIHYNSRFFAEVQTLIAVIVIIIGILLAVAGVRYALSDILQFYSTGMDAGFTFSEIRAFWQLAKQTNLAEPTALFVSPQTLNKAITAFITESRANHTDMSAHYQHLLGKLYKYRTKIDIAHENKRTLDSTLYLDKGQRLRVILPGHGVFQSEILKNDVNIVIKLPTQKNVAKLAAEKWLKKDVSVYLWRKGDAGYVFDSTVLAADLHNGYPALHLQQTNKLLRTQKRRSVRAACTIMAQLYVLSGEKQVDYNTVEMEPGCKCLLEDISEDGALIRVGGKGRSNVPIKIQFELDGKLIVMFGLVRAVEYNKAHNQSRLHFECVHISDDRRNAVLSFVYNTLPASAKEVLEALRETEADGAQDTPAQKTERPRPLTTERPLAAAIRSSVPLAEKNPGELDSLAAMSVEEEA